MKFPTRRAAGRVAHLVPLLLVLLLLLVAAQSAAAGPPGPTMNLTELETALQAGPVNGYLLTTMKGTTPEQIPVQVQSIVDYSDGRLILFEASGPQMDRIGSIAHGMSGSPIYVSVGGLDKLVGALSYGDDFTLHGLGLATPIEYMTAIEDAYPVSALAAVERARPPAAGVYALDAPVRTSQGVVASVRVTRSAEAAANATPAAHQSVMAPLGLLEIGGAPAGSAAFDRVAARFAKSGFLVKAAPGNGAGATAPTPNLAPGSPCGVLFSEGSVWVGAFGTVTYVDGNAAMLFGHPFQRFGAMEADLTGANVGGVWASGLASYMLMAPRDVKGACVQDRGWGVLGALGRKADSFPMTTTITTAQPKTLNDETSVGQWLFTGGAYPDLPADIVATLAGRALDQDFCPGSAETRTSIVVADDSGTYTVSRNNVWSDSFDVSWLTGMDAGDALLSLSENPDGILRPHVVSVDVTAAISPVQRGARIANVTLPDGWSHGANRVRVEYYRYGSPALQTLETTLVVPAGTSLYGRLGVRPAVYYSDDEEGGGEPVAATPPLTLKELVDRLNTAPTNSDLIVSYQSGDGEGMTPPAAIEKTVATGYVFAGDVSYQTAFVTLHARPKTVTYGGTVAVTGTVGSSKDVPVEIYRRDAGAAAAVKVATLTAVSKEGMARFGGVVTGVKRNTTLIARVASADGSLPGSASAAVKVSPRIWLSGTSRLTVHVLPAGDGKVMLQRQRGGVWRNYKSVKIVGGRGTTRLPKGIHVLRVKVPAGALNAAGTSPAFTIKVK